MNFPLWLRQLVGLCLRSTMCALVIVSSVLAAVTVSAGSAMNTLQNPSAEGEAIAAFGSASTTIINAQWPLAQAGKPLPQLITPSKELIAVWQAEVPLALDGEKVIANYVESSWPSLASENRFMLSSGRWPSTPGECVASRNAKQLGPTIGQWNLRITGQFYEHRRTRPSMVLCAEGTLAQWKLTADVLPLLSVEANATVYSAARSEAEASAILKHYNWLPEETYVQHRDETHYSGLSSADLITGYGPWILIALAAVTGASVFLGRWLQQHSRILRCIGGEVHRFLGVCLAIICAVVLLSSLVTCLLSYRVFKALEPHGIAAFDLPGEVAFQPWLVIVIPVLNVAGLLIGCFFGLRSVQSRAGKESSAKQPPQLTVRTLRVAAAASFLLWVAVTLGADKNFWQISGALFFLIAGLSCSAPLVARYVLARYDDAAPGPLLLATRQMQQSGKSAPLAALTAVLSLLIVSAAGISANGSVVAAVTGGVVPQGTAMIGTTTLASEAVPERILQDFHQQLSPAHSPLRITESLIHPTDGYVMNFATLEDAKTILGELSPEQEEVLTSGGVLEQAFNNSGGIFRTETSEHVELRVLSYSPPNKARFNTAGFAIESALDPALRPTPEAPSWQLYYELTPAQEALAKHWIANTGFTNMRLYTYSPATLELIRTATLSVLIVTGLGLWLTITHLLRGEVKQLRGVIAGLEAAGIPRRWTLQSLIFSSLWLTLIPVVSSLVGAVGAVTLLKLCYPHIFDPFGVPWLALLGASAAVILAGIGGAVSATRKINHRERAEYLT